MLNLILGFCLFLSGLHFDGGTSAQLGSGFGSVTPVVGGTSEGPLNDLLVAVNDLSMGEESLDSTNPEPLQQNEANNNQDYVANLDDMEDDLATTNYEPQAAPAGCGPVVRKCQPVARCCKPKPVARCCQPKPKTCCHKPMVRKCQPVARCCKPKPVARCCQPKPKTCCHKPMVRKCQPVARCCKPKPVARCCQPKPKTCCHKPVVRKCQPVARCYAPPAPVGCAPARVPAPAGCGPAVSNYHQPTQSADELDDVAPAREPISSSSAAIW
jgi:hypothetical protein